MGGVLAQRWGRPHSELQRTQLRGNWGVEPLTRKRVLPTLWVSFTFLRVTEGRDGVWREGIGLEPGEATILQDSSTETQLGVWPPPSSCTHKITHTSYKFQGRCILSFPEVCGERLMWKCRGQWGEGFCPPFSYSLRLKLVKWLSTPGVWRTEGYDE